MEAATPLRQPNVRTLGEHLAIDGLVVDDEAAVRLGREREVAEFMGEKVDDVFRPEDGQLAKELEKLFSEGSSASVQNQIEKKLTEAHAKYREDLLRQFS